MNQDLYNKLVVALGFFKEENRFTSEINEITETVDGAKEEFYAERKAKKDRVLNLRVFLFFAKAVPIVLIAAFIIGPFIGIEMIAKDVVIAIVSAIVFVVAFIVDRKLKKIYFQHDVKTEEEWKNFIDVEHAVVVRHLAELVDGREKFRKEFGEFVEFIPVKYRNLQAVAYFLTMVQDERADSMKEAMRMYDEQLHRWKMENSAARTAQAQEFEAAAMMVLNSQQAQSNQYLRQIRDAEYIRLLNDVMK